MSEFWLYIKLGFGHVIDWYAFDHVLFFIVLIAGYTSDSWKRILTLVTLFTIGHTVALFFAAHKIVNICSNYIEFLIPLTIMITGFHAIYTARGATKSYPKTTSPSTLYAITTFFGIIHGLGFATYFKAISSNTKALALPLLEFALGIELAQLLVVVCFLILSSLFQHFFKLTKRDWVFIVSSIVIGMAFMLLLENKIW